MANEVKFEVTLEEKQAIDAIKKLTKNIDSFETVTKKSFKNATSAFNFFKGALAADVVVNSFNTMKNAAESLFDLIINDGVNSAIKEEQALTRLETSLKLAGKSTVGAKKDFLDFANALEDTTGVQDDVILNNVALLQSLTKLSNAGLKQATTAAIDMSKALGIDLESATRALGAAATGNTALLQRLTKQAFVEGANDAETFQLALEKLNKSFGGAAVANFKTFEGAVSSVKNSFEDFIKELGKTITENSAVKNAIKEVGEAFKILEQFVKNNKKGLDELVTSLANNFNKAVKEGVVLLTDFLKFLIDNQTAVKDLVATLAIAVAGYTAYTAATYIATTATTAFGVAGKSAAAAMVIVTGKAALIVAAITGLSYAVLKLVQNFDFVSGTVKKFIGDTLINLANELKAPTEGAGFLGKALAKMFPSSLRESIKKYGESLAEAGQKQLDAAKKAEEADKNRTNSAKEAENQIKGTYDRTGDAFGLLYLKQLDVLNNYYVTKREKELEEQGKALVDQQTFNQQLLDQYAFYLGQDELVQQLSNIRKLEEDGKTKDALRERAKLHNKYIEAEEKRSATDRLDWEKKTSKEKLQYLGSIFGDIAALQSESSQELFAIGKAGAIAQAIVSGYLGVARALEVPPPFGFILAGLVATASAANLAKIVAAQPPPKRQTGGILPGVASPTDTGVFQGAPGELVLNRRQQTNLFNAINQNQIGNSGSNVVINIQGNVMADDDSQVQKLIERINDNIQFRNAVLV